MPVFLSYFYCILLILLSVTSLWSFVTSIFYFLVDVRRTKKEGSSNKIGMACSLWFFYDRKNLKSFRECFWSFCLEYFLLYSLKDIENSNKSGKSSVWMRFIQKDLLIIENICLLCFCWQTNFSNFQLTKILLRKCCLPFCIVYTRLLLPLPRYWKL